jgi:hypothetical protein
MLFDAQSEQVDGKIDAKKDMNLIEKKLTLDVRLVLNVWSQNVYLICFVKGDKNQFTRLYDRRI